MIKKILSILCLSVITSSAFAQYGNQFGILTISSNNNQKFWLFVDDVLQNEYSTNIIKLQGLQYIYYKIRIEMDNSANNTVGQNVLISNMQNNNNYIVTMERGNIYSFKRTQNVYQPFFVQNIILPNYNYYSYYDQFLYPGFNSNVTYGQGFKGNPYKKYQNNSLGYGGNQGYGNQPGYGNSPPSYGNPPGHSNPPPPLPPPPHNTACMHPTDFSRALSTIQQESFENSKLNVAKQVTSNNRLCVSQIMQICGLFSFENTKLDYAKYAYEFCFDKNNYYQVNEVFSFSSSKDELRKYIGY